MIPNINYLLHIYIHTLIHIYKCQIKVKKLLTHFSLKKYIIFCPEPPCSCWAKALDVGKMKWQEQMARIRWTGRPNCLLIERMWNFPTIINQSNSKAQQLNRFQRAKISVTVALSKYLYGVVQSRPAISQRLCKEGILDIYVCACACRAQWS